MIARFSSPIILLLVSRIWVSILLAHVLGGGVVSASTPLDRTRTSDHVTSTPPTTLGETKTSFTSEEVSEPTSDEVADSDSDQHWMGYPDSLKLKPRVVSLNIMVAGLAGLGKTTLCRALLDAWWQELREEQNDSVGVKSKTKASGIGRFAFLKSSSSSSSAASSSKIVNRNPGKPTVSTTEISPSAPFEYFDEKANTILRVRIIDTPGFGNRVNHKNSVKPITDYISDCRRKRFKNEQSPSFKSSSTASLETGRFSRSETSEDDDANNRLLVHVCLYFLSPGRFLAIDRHFLKHVQDEVTIVPVISKADTMTDDEIARYRAELSRIWEEENINVYSLDERTQHKRGFGRVIRTEKFYRGRHEGEVLAIISRDGDYPWGHSCSLDPEHSDLKMIRDSLLSEHTERFLELATSKYTAYRNARIAKQRRTEFLKYTALMGLAAAQLGRLELQGTSLRSIVSRGLSFVASYLQHLRVSLHSRRFQRDESDVESTDLEDDSGSDNDGDENNSLSEPTKDRKNKGFFSGIFGKASSDSNDGIEVDDSEQVEPMIDSARKKKKGFFGKISSDSNDGGEVNDDKPDETIINSARDKKKRFFGKASTDSKDESEIIANKPDKAVTDSGGKKKKRSLFGKASPDSQNVNRDKKGRRGNTKSKPVKKEKKPFLFRKQEKTVAQKNENKRQPFRFLRNTSSDPAGKK